MSTTANINELIEHTLLKPEATSADIAKLCAEAREHKFHGVCVHSHWIPDAKKNLQGSDVKVVTVVGFPHGASSSLAKAAETRIAVEAGADEVDMVINLGAVKEGHWDFIEHEIHELVSAAQGRPLKVIIEIAALTPEEISEASRRAVKAGAAFVKTATGYGPGGATPEAVARIREAAGCKAGIKASGGVKDRAGAEALIAAGATRLGTSNGVALLK
ncbi:MAG: deoxyribose-phosphate aldolase [Verrucomicrobium sp.]|nr:deoxyribose-phosphate aldolase [Verrucomicrobium sp.]